MQVTNIYNNVEKAKDYQNKIELRSNIKKWREFYKGNQWSGITDRTKNFPRPVFNIIKMIIESKASAIGGSPIQIKFSSQVEDQAGRLFNEFTQTILKRLDFNNKLYKMTLRALVDSASILHFYWDENMTDDKGAYKGGLNAELINITNVYFSDPEESDIQKQRWIIIELRQPVAYLKSICEDEKERKKIVSDDFDNDGIQDAELDDDSLATVYIKYYRNEDGEVLYTKATKYATITKDNFLNIKKRSVEEDDLDEDDNLEIDKGNKDEYTAENTDSMSLEQEDDHLDKKNKRELIFSRYPLVMFTPNPDDESIYGTSDVKDLINVQRSINASIAFSLLTLQNSGSPKIIAKKGALKGQEITNEVGEVLIDHTPIGTQGFYTLQQQPSVAGALQLAPQMLDFIRTITNTSEIITGDNINTNVSGTAIAQAQSQAKQRIKLQENQLFLMVKNAVKIIEQFQKMYYIDDEFNYRANLQEKLNAMSLGVPLPNYYESTFNSIDYEDKEFAVEIEVGYGTQYSESLEITMLDNLLSAQYIDFDTYVDLCPQSVMPFKAQLREKIQIQQQTELYQAKKQNAELSQQVEQMAIYSKQQEKALKEALQNVNREAQLRKQVTSEAEQKINALQQQIEELQKNNDSITSMFSKLVYGIQNAKGNKGESSDKLSQ